MKNKQQPDWAVITHHRGHLVVGVDEVGRGSWAGPVVAAAVVLAYGQTIPGLADSKQLTSRQRQSLNRDIRLVARAIGIGWVAATEIDTNGLTWAVRQSGLKAVKQCLEVLDIPDDHCRVILDGKDNYLSDIYHSECFIKADACIAPVAAASVIAKVARDRYMKVIARQIPGYGFERHVGYGTELHQSALKQLGVSPLHRRSYRPLQGIILNSAKGANT